MLIITLRVCFRKLKQTHQGSMEERLTRVSAMVNYEDWFEFRKTHQIWVSMMYANNANRKFISNGLTNWVRRMDELWKTYSNEITNSETFIQ